MARGPAERALLAAALLFAASAGAAELGTLFHTPEERARLDRLRRGEPAAAAGASAAVTAQPQVTGYVKRSDGRSTVWIDGVPVPVPTQRADPLMDPKGVRAYADRKDGELRIERKPAR